MAWCYIESSQLHCVEVNFYCSHLSITEFSMKVMASFYTGNISFPCYLHLDKMTLLMSACNNRVFEKAFHMGIWRYKYFFKDNEKGCFMFLLDWKFYRNGASNVTFEIPTMFNKQHFLTYRTLLEWESTFKMHKIEFTVNFLWL